MAGGAVRLLAGILVWLLFATANASTSQEPPTVLATVKPLHSLASVVTEGVSVPQLLISGSTSPHLFQVKPSHIRSVRDADIIVWAGEGVERFLPSLVNKFNRQAELLEIAATDGAVLHASRNKHRKVDFSDAESIDRDEIDYHLWLDPDNALIIVDLLAARLSELDPANAAAYLSNAKSFNTALATSVVEVEKLLSVVTGRRYLIYHDSLQYIEKAFGLGEAIVIAPQPQVQAGGKRLRALYGELADEKPGCLFSEPQFRSSVVKTLADDLGLKRVTVDPLAYDFTAGAGLYNEWLLHTATTIAECLASASDVRIDQ